MIKVLVADDSAIVRAMLAQVIGDDPRFSLTGFAVNGRDALEKNSQLNPDLIVMDINMPIMDGIQASRKILEYSNPAIIAFTTEDTAKIGFSSLEAGVLEVIEKPDLATMNREMLREFCDRMFLIAEKHRKDLKKRGGKPLQAISGFTENELKGFFRIPSSGTKYRVLLVGSSTGGPAALQKLLKGLGKRFPLPVLITQHIDSTFDRQLADWLSETTGFDTRLAQDGDRLEKSRAYLAPSGFHLTVAKEGVDTPEYRIVLEDSDPIHFLKPAVDRMFSNAASVFGQHAISVLLTGMGRDGAKGSLDLAKKGALTIAQDEPSCMIFGMPKAAMDLGAIRQVISLDDMGECLKKLAGATL